MENSRTPTVRSIMAGVGFACYIIWDFVGSFGPALSFSDSFETSWAILFQIFSFGILIASYLIAGQNADAILKRRKSLLGASTCLLLTALAISFGCANIENPPYMLGALMWTLMSLGRSCLALMWTALFSLRADPNAPLSIASAFVSSILLFMGLISIPAVSLYFGANAFLVIIAAVMLATLSKGLPLSELDSLKLRRFSPFITDNAALLVIQGTVQGFVFLIMISYGKPAVALGLLGMLIGNVVAFVSILSSQRNAFDLSIFMNRSFPFFLAGLLFIPFLDGIAIIVCCCFVSIAAAYQSTMAWVTTTASNKKFGLNPITHFAYGRIPSLIGFIAGETVAFALYHLLPLTDTALALFTILFTLAILISFIARGPEGAYKKFFGKKPSADCGKNPEGTKAEHQKMHFRERCDKVILDNKLSPRESEVFVFLAKGRDADYISKKLFISFATVKSHIYHIYMKLGVNSHQTLIDMVEEATIDDNPNKNE